MSSLVRSFTQLLSLVFILLGVAGFFTGDYVLWFEVNAIHNVVHIASGALGFIALNMHKERFFLMVFGLVYGLVAVLGFVLGGDILGLFHANTADNYLHTAIAASCLIISGMSKK